LCGQWRDYHHCGATVAAQLNTGPITQGRSVCVPYDPASLTLVQMQGTGDWQLRRGDGAIFKLFSDREDAEAGVAVAKQHTNCAISARVTPALIASNTSWSIGSNRSREKRGVATHEY